MRAILQRIESASLTVDDKLVSKVGNGLCVYLGINENDTIVNAEKLAKKLANLRVFDDEDGKINYSVKDIDGEILVISNFTVYADSSRGTRPNFMYAMKSEEANLLYKKFIGLLEKEDVKVKEGVFGGHMIINQVNKGPVTIVLEF